MIVEFKDFYATQMTTPTKEHTLCAGGTCVFPTSGYSAHLEARRPEGNVGINPTIFYLDVVVEPPGPDEIVQEVLTPVELEEWCLNDPPREYTEVHFRLLEVVRPSPPSVDVDVPRSS